MKHVVARNLVLDADVTAVLEFSRAIDMAEDNAVMIEIWTRTVTSSGVATIAVEVQGSNDLVNWEPIDSTMSVSVDTGTGKPPLYSKHEVATTIGWAYVRIRYSATASTAYVLTLGAAITTTRRGS